MTEYLFEEVILSEKGFLRGPFGGDLKKEIFVPKGEDTYKVYEQGVVLQKDKDIGNYYISKSYFDKKMYRFEVKKKDFLVSCSGANYGAIFQLKDTIENGVINQALLRIRLNNHIIDDDYFYYLFNHHIVNMIVGKKGDSTIPNFPPISVIKKLKFGLPKLEIQQKIAKSLSTVDAKIELNNRINKELEAMAKTLYDYWFVQFDFPHANNKPYKSSGGKMVYNEELKREIPEGWEVSELKGHISIERGLSYKSNELCDTGIPMINLNSFYLNGTYKPEGIKYFTGKYNLNKIIKPEELIIATTDVTRNADIIGKAVIVPNIYEKDVVLSCDIAKVICKNSLDKFFLEKLFNSESYHNYIKGFASGTLVLHLNTDGMDWYKLCIPPKNILNKFSDFMKNIQKKKDLTIKENKNLTQLRDFLLPMLMNGQARVA